MIAQFVAAAVRTARPLVCPTPAQPEDQSKREGICDRCGTTGHMQAECQEMVARRTETNSNSAAPRLTPSARQPCAPNAPTATTEKPIDSKRLALLGKEIDESIGISNSGKHSFVPEGQGTILT